MRVFAALHLLSLAAVAHAFIPAGVRSHRSAVALAANPFDTLFAVLKEGKVGLVKSLAGDYDSTAIRTKINSLVDSTPVLMFSFTT